MCLAFLNYTLAKNTWKHQLTPCLRLGIGQKIRRFPDLEIWAPGTLFKTSWKFHQHLLGAFWFFALFVFFEPIFTGIKGATVQMLPWEAPTDLKTLPMGILHDYMSCWTTLGPFGYPRGPQNGPKQYQNGLKWLKITRIAQNGTAWPQMTLKHFQWVYYMIICHVGPPWALFRGPRGPHNGPKQHQDSPKYHQNGPPWPQMSLHDPKWP